VHNAARELSGEQPDKRQVQVAGQDLLGHLPTARVAHQNLHPRVRRME
jgi:hypothetical protein